MAKCMWCGEQLIFSRGKGWVHRDGKVYKTRVAYPRFCPVCVGLLLDGFCGKCLKQYPKQEIDDHCALPIRG